MPPRKSNVSVVTNGEEDNSTIQVMTSTPATKAPRESLGVEDLNLPRTMIQRLAKGVLPSNTQIQKDALLALSKSATVFVNFIANAANEQARLKQKKTISPEHVYAALEEEEFASLVARVKAEVTKYNETQSTKRNAYRRTKKAEQQAAEGAVNGDAMDITEAGDETMASIMTNGDDAGERPLKKVRRDDEDEDVADDEDEPIEEDIEEDSADEDDVEEEIEEEVEEEQPDEAEHEADGGFLNGIRDEALDEPDSD